MQESMSEYVSKVAKKGVIEMLSNVQDKGKCKDFGIYVFQRALGKATSA